jgi:hypothetical protein
MRNCGTVISTGSYFDYGRLESETPDHLGCQVGWWGNSLGLTVNSLNVIPGGHATGRFAIRLPNITNVGGAGSSSGPVLPIELQMGTDVGTGTCSPLGSLLIRRAGTMSRDGYSCKPLGNYTGSMSYHDTLRCTLIDGTQYDLKLTNQNVSDGYQTFLGLNTYTYP